MARILVVDDDQDICHLAEKILRYQNHVVVLASNGLEALDKLANLEFDLVITDANMPQMGGFDLLKRIKNSNKHSNIPVAVLTARREKKDVEMALKFGADDYIVKPIDAHLFVTKVENLLSKSPDQEGQSFAEIPTSRPGTLLLTTQIRAVSELGLTLISNTPLKEKTTYQFDTPIFQEINVPSCLLKVITCDNIDKDQWRIKTNFVGPDMNFLNHLRAWIVQESTRRLKKTA